MHANTAKVPRASATSGAGCNPSGHSPAEPGHLLARIYFRGGPHPPRWSRFRHLGLSNARCDYHLPDIRGISSEESAVFSTPRELPPGTERAPHKSSSWPMLQGRMLLRSVQPRSFKAPGRKIGTAARPSVPSSGSSVRSISLISQAIGLSVPAHPLQSPLATEPRSAIEPGDPYCLPQYRRPSIPLLNGGGGVAVALYERSSEALPVRPVFNRQLSGPLLTDAPAEVAALTGFDIVLVRRGWAATGAHQHLLSRRLSHHPSSRKNLRVFQRV